VQNRFKTKKNRIKLDMRESNMMREMQEVIVRLGMVEQSITRVILSPDWRYATVYCISNVSEDDELSAKNLEEQSNQITKLLKHRCSGHFFPKLRFLPDKEIRKQQSLDQILMGITVDEE
jgi:ribosome-binding factor A